jgi:exosome complex RNA-binding protein Rrp42 (RNase PH superfamily)
VVTCEVVPPYPDRPTEGFLNLNVEISPMAATGVDVSGEWSHASIAYLSAGM